MCRSALQGLSAFVVIAFAAGACSNGFAGSDPTTANVGCSISQQPQPLSVSYTTHSLSHNTSDYCAPGTTPHVWIESTFYDNTNTLVGVRFEAVGSTWEVLVICKYNVGRSYKGPIQRNKVFDVQFQACSEHLEVRVAITGRSGSGEVTSLKIVGFTTDYSTYDLLPPPWTATSSCYFNLDETCSTSLPPQYRYQWPATGRCVSYCYAPYVYYDDTRPGYRPICAFECPDGFGQPASPDANQQYKCFACQDGCAECNDATTCTQCDTASGYRLKGSECVTDCGSGYFDNGIMCIECVEGCTQCSPTCTACDTANGYRLKGDMCVQDCGPNYLDDSAACHECAIGLVGEAYPGAIMCVPKYLSNDGIWTLVRHVPVGGSWHPANDELVGTATYGVPSSDPAAPAWTVPFEHVNFDQFLFATGDFKHWAIVERCQVVGRHADALPPLTILNSTRSPAAPYTVQWYNRLPGNPQRCCPEDPWISYNDHFHYGHHGESDEHSMLYGEAGAVGWSYWISRHQGANVFIRKASKPADDCQSHNLQLAQQSQEENEVLMDQVEQLTRTVTQLQHELAAKTAPGPKLFRTRKLPLK